MTGTFMIDGVEIPVPLKWEFSVEDLSSEETGRTLDGVMHKDVVDVKDTYTAEWGTLSLIQAATLLNAVDGKTEIMLTYPDPRVPTGFMTNRFYIGKRKAAALDLSDDGRAWKGIGFTFIRI